MRGRRVVDVSMFMGSNGILRHRQKQNKETAEMKKEINFFV
jgi:hypothetical protein